MPGWVAMPATGEDSPEGVVHSRSIGQISVSAQGCAFSRMNQPDETQPGHPDNDEGETRAPSASPAEEGGDPQSGHIRGGDVSAKEHESDPDPHPAPTGPRSRPASRTKKVASGSEW